MSVGSFEDEASSLGEGIAIAAPQGEIVPDPPLVALSEDALNDLIKDFVTRDEVLDLLHAQQQALARPALGLFGILFVAFALPFGVALWNASKASKLETRIAELEGQIRVLSEAPMTEIADEEIADDAAVEEGTPSQSGGEEPAPRDAVVIPDIMPVPPEAQRGKPPPSIPRV